jgi:hypothetical protein
MFHVYPTPAGVQHLHAQNGVNYLSRGLGPGPWHISLTRDVSQIAEDRFDLILVEAGAALESLSAAERGDFVRALAWRVRITGMLGVVAGAEKGFWLELFGWHGLSVVAEGGRWIIMARKDGAP